MQVACAAVTAERKRRAHTSSGARERDAGCGNRAPAASETRAAPATITGSCEPTGTTLPVHGDGRGSRRLRGRRLHATGAWVERCGRAQARGGDNNHISGRVSDHRLCKRAAGAPVATRLPLWPSRHDRRRPRARAHAAIFEGHSPGLASRLAEHLSAAPRGRRSMAVARLRGRTRPSAPDRPRAARCIRPDPLPAHTDLLLPTSNGASCDRSDATRIPGGAVIRH